MSFSSDIKSELTAMDNLPQCCNHAQVYGLVLFAHFSSINFSIKTENKDVFDLYCKSVRNIIKTDPEINDECKKKYSAMITDMKALEKILDEFGHSVNETSTRINFGNIQNECCMQAFLRGVFLSCGSISDPEKNYHLEFVVPFKKLSQDLMKALNEVDLNPKYIVRKGNHIVYFKDSESIEDFLAFIGAQNASLYLMNIKIEKDVKNSVNRKLNFEIHNIEKTVSAATKQIDAIKYIVATSGLGILPENLQKLALLRIDNPEASLEEIHELYDENISRSGIKHRLDRIVEISNRLRDKKDGGRQ